MPNGVKLGWANFAEVEDLLHVVGVVLDAVDHLHREVANAFDGHRG